MSKIALEQVKELHEITGELLMECKKALNQAEGNMDEAIKILKDKSPYLKLS